jgi:hypothetical protein
MGACIKCLVRFYSDGGVYKMSGGDGGVSKMSGAFLQ